VTQSLKRAAAAASHEWYPDRDRMEWIVDAAVHAVGLAAAAAGVVALFLVAAGRVDAGGLLGLGLYALGLLAMLIFSTLYNTNRTAERSKLYERLDLAGIYLMIAGTYTPLVWTKLSGPLAAALLTFVWGGALAGVGLKLFTRWHAPKVFIGLYLALGWVAVIAIKPLAQAMSTQGLILLAIGGIVYSAGVPFHVWRKLRFNAAIWHAFVVAAAACQFMAIFLDVALAGG